MKSKLVLASLVLALFVIAAIPTASAALAFTPEQRDSQLSWIDKFRQHFFGFTIAGQQRQCSTYPDESGYINNIPYSVSCSGKEGLINFYAIQSTGGWNYMTEVECPANFNPATSTSPVGRWAYEVYYCPTPEPTGTEGEKRCISEKQGEVFRNGAWQTFSCNIGQVCSSGNCITVVSGACLVDGHKYAVAENPLQYKVCVNQQYQIFDCLADQTFNAEQETCEASSVTAGGGTGEGSGKVPFWAWIAAAGLGVLAFSPPLRKMIRLPF